jgi:hypothetical protein
MDASASGRADSRSDRSRLPGAGHWGFIDAERARRNPSPWLSDAAVPSSYFTDDLVWEAPDTLPTGPVIRGRDAVLER